MPQISEVQMPVPHHSLHLLQQCTTPVAGVVLKWISSIIRYVCSQHKHQADWIGPEQYTILMMRFVHPVQRLTQ